MPPRLSRQLRRLREIGVLRLADGTCVSKPASKGTDWRVHGVFDLASGGFSHLELTDEHGAEALERGAPIAGEIRIRFATSVRSFPRVYVEAVGENAAGCAIAPQGRMPLGAREDLPILTDAEGATAAG